MNLRTTEQRHPDAPGLDTRAAGNVLTVLLDGQAAAVSAVRAATQDIADMAALISETLRSGGDLYYVAAGSSGLMGLSDGLELPGTFGIPKERIHIKLAGGAQSLTDLAGSVEDDEAAARQDAASVSSDDCVICISASGSTPYPVAFQELAKAAGAHTISIANTPDSPLLRSAEVAVYLPTPSEVIAGSTRLGAATAQKVALNMASTLAGIQLGHVYDGHMVNLFADNKKLVERAARMVSDISGCSDEQAASVLSQTEGAVKPAVLLALGAETLEHAQELLDRAEQNLRSAISDLTPGFSPAKRRD